jgi:hypothetical protein
MDSILEGLPDLVKDKVGQCSSTKELWDKLHNLYSKGFHSITEPENSKEDTRMDQEEICSSCQTNSEEEYCEVGVVDFEVEPIYALSELRK